MGGNRKKPSKSSKKKQEVSEAPKYKVAPLSPVLTRSTKKKSHSVGAVPPSSESASPTPAPPIVESVEVVPDDPLQQLEERWDVRFARMETAIRSGLSSTASSSRQPAAAAACRPDSEDNKEKKHKSSSKKSSRHRSPSTSSSSSASSAEDYSSSESESESETESSSKKKSKKKGKYNTAKYLKEGDKLDSYERLVLANARMALALYKKGRNIKGLLQHIILVADKAQRCLFASQSLIDYDASVKLTAKEEGLRSMGKVDPSTIMQYLCYDGTLAAEKARKSEVKRRPGRGGTRNILACYAHNYNQGGCPGGCGYRHVCTHCGSSGHINSECTSKKEGAAKGGRK